MVFDDDDKDDDDDDDDDDGDDDDDDDDDDGDNDDNEAVWRHARGRHGNMRAALLPFARPPEHSAKASIAGCA